MGYFSPPFLNEFAITSHRRFGTVLLLTLTKLLIFFYFKHITTMKILSSIIAGAFVLSAAGCGNVGDANERADGDVRTETKVVDVDTVGAETTYDVRKRTIEQVDTVGATTEYDVEKQVVRRTVDVDTLTEDVDGEARVDMKEGDYKTVDTDVETETVTEEVDIDN